MTIIDKVKRLFESKERKYAKEISCKILMKTPEQARSLLEDEKNKKSIEDFEFNYDLDERTTLVKFIFNKKKSVTVLIEPTKI